MNKLTGLFRVVRLEVPCASCNETTLQIIGDLVANNVVACPFCGTDIDVSSQEWRTFIDEFAEALTHIRSYRS